MNTNYSEVPNKGVLTNRRRQSPKFNKRGVKINQVGWDMSRGINDYKNGKNKRRLSYSIKLKCMQNMLN